MATAADEPEKLQTEEEDKPKRVPRPDPKEKEEALAEFEKEISELKWGCDGDDDGDEDDDDDGDDGCDHVCILTISKCL